MIYRERVNTTTSVNTLPYVWELDVPIASGNISLFWQAVAPTGWTKQSTHNNKTLRVVSGTAGSGGATDFTTVFSNQALAVGGVAVDSTTITTLTMASHTHFDGGTSLITNNPENSFRGFPYATAYVSTRAGSTVAASGNSGGGLGHTHPLTVGITVPVAIKYIDIIFAMKD